MTNASHSLDTVFARRGWLAAQPPDLRAAVLACGHHRRFKRGEYLHHMGDEPGGIYGVISGGLGVMLGRRDATLGLCTIVRAGTWIGEAPLQSGGTRIASLRAVETLDVLSVELSDLNRIAGNIADVRRRYGWALLFNTEHALQVISDLQIPSIARRLAATLLRVTAVDEGVEPDHPDGFMITQSELGEMANVSRNSVNRTLAEFARQGWVAVRYNRIRITNPAALQRFVGAGER